MLISKTTTDSGAIIGICHMTESKSELLEQFPLSLQKNAYEYINNIRSDKRAIEWLSSRIMITQLLGKGIMLLNSPTGKPYLKDNSYNVSITHSKDYAAAILHKEMHVGIDIEYISNRVERIRDRFISDKEYIDHNNSIIHQLLHWSAKESLFKLIGRQEIDLKQHLFISPFTPSNKGLMKATEYKTYDQQSYDIHYEVFEKYVLTWIVSP